MMTLYDDTSFPTVYGLLSSFREIVIKENVDIVHIHQVSIVFT
jgi:hypothetical protein